MNGWEVVNGIPVTVPVPAGDVVLIGSNSACGGSGAILGLRAADGHLVWSIPRPIAPRTTPVVSGDSAFVSLEDGSLVSLSPATGSIRWENKNVGVGSPSGQPLLYRDEVIVASLDDTYAVDGRTGAVLWQASGWSDPVLSTDGALYVIDAQPSTSATGVVDARLDPATGKRIWVVHEGRTSASVTAVTSRTVILTNMPREVYALEPATGHLRWEHHVDSFGELNPYRDSAPHGGPVLITPGAVLVSEGVHTVITLDVRTGAVLWRRSDATADPVVGDGGDVFFATKAGVSRIDPLTGRALWSTTTSMPPLELCFSGGRLLSSLADRRVVVLTPSGSTVATVAVPAMPTRTMALSGGRLLIRAAGRAIASLRM